MTTNCRLTKGEDPLMSRKSPEPQADAGPERDRVAAELKTRYEAGPRSGRWQRRPAAPTAACIALWPMLGRPSARRRGDALRLGFVIPLPPHRTKGGVLLGAAGPGREGPFGHWGEAEEDVTGGGSIGMSGTAGPVQSR